jgi:hypothetical protein
MNGTLSLSTRSLGYSDPTNPGNDPQKRNVDWRSSITVAAKNVSGVPYTIPVGASVTLFDGTRSNSSDGTTQWTLALSTLSSDRYRFTNSAGTAPVLRTPRTLALGATVTVLVNANQTATFTSTASAFTAVQVGDTVFVPGVTTGDTGPFSPLNQGFWTVLSVAVDGSNVQLTRGAGVTFQGWNEVVSVSSGQVKAFSAAGVQIGDGVFISAGFSTPVLRGYTVVSVTATWFEVISTSPLPVSAVAIPGASGLQFYSSAKRYVELWADQDCVLRLNGDTTDSNKVSPWQAGDVTQAGIHAHAGISWSAVIVNKSTAPLNIQLITAE